LKCSIISKIVLKSLLSVFILSLFFGCADNSKNTKKDPFFEKWNTAAENSQGHSPSAEPKKISVSDLAAKQVAADALTAAGTKKLPSKLINLTMRQVELKSVLRALARSVDLNILVKNDLKGEINVDFKNVPWGQAFTGLLRTYGLSFIWEGDIIRVLTIEDMDQDLKQKISRRDIQWVEPILQPVVISIDYADAKKLADTLQDFLTKDKEGKPRGSVKHYEHNNSLVISAIREDLNRMLPIIEKLDKPTPQILIKANIVETTKEVARDLGIMWGGKYNTGDYTATGGTGSPVGIGGSGLGVNFPAANLSAAASGSLALLFGTIGGNLLEVQLQALQKDSKLNILSSPSITTLDNQLAYTENGEKVPYVTVQSGTSSTVPTYTTNFEDVSLRLEITPHVIDGKNLKMKISVKKDEVDLTRKDSLGDPYIIKKKTETNLIVKDGETIVISGLTKQTRADGNTGWPGLKDIPILGWVFKADSKDDKMEEVLIFITPHILEVSSNSQSNAAPIVEGTSSKKDAEVNQKEPEKKVN